jgi:hypothetical protein
MRYLEGIRMDYDTADMITRLSLIDSLEGIDKLISVLRGKDSQGLKDFEKEDLEDNLKYREAVLVVIDYYSTRDQMSELKIS